MDYSNAHKSPKDKLGGKINRRDAKNFKNFLDNYCLLDFDLKNANYIKIVIVRVIVKLYPLGGLVDSYIVGNTIVLLLIKKRIYMHKNTGGSMSRRDRFLTSASWVEFFGAHQENAGSYTLSDHRMLLFQGYKPFGGPRPFHFELFWLELPNIMQLLEN